MKLLRKPLFQFIMIAILIIAAHGLTRRSAKSSSARMPKHMITAKE